MLFCVRVYARAHVCTFSVCAWVFQLRELKSRTNQKLPDSTRPYPMWTLRMQGQLVLVERGKERQTESRRKYHDVTAMHYSWFGEDIVSEITIIFYGTTYTISIHLFIYVWMYQTEMMQEDTKAKRAPIHQSYVSVRQTALKCYRHQMRLCFLNQINK